MMKYIMLTLFLSIFTFHTKAQYTVQEDFAKHFLKSINSENFDSLRVLIPNIETYRVISPDETKGKTEKELKPYIEIHIKTLENDFNKILESAQKEKIKLNQLKFYEVETEFLPIQPFIFFSIQVHFSYKKQKGVFLLNVVNHENHWSLLKIVNAEDIFELILDR